MIKKISLSLVALVLVSGTILFVNQNHVIRYLFDLPEYSHEPGYSGSQMLSMRDGVKLFTRTYLPKGEGSWPVILVRYPYEKADMLMPFICQMFNSYGYGCVLQLTRGMGISGGEWEPVVNEPYDGSDTLYWIAKQKWMDGNIAMWGSSYLAFTQWAAAFDYPKELKTFVPAIMGTSFKTALFEKGAFRHFVTAWVSAMPDGDMDPTSGLGRGDDYIDALKQMPHVDIDENYIGQRVDWYRMWVDSTSPSAPAWSREDAKELAAVTSKLDIPVLMLGGWYDPFFAAEFDDYKALATRKNSRMIIGPWNHLSKPAGDLLTDDLKSLTRTSIVESLVWFDHHLKGKPMDEPGYVRAYDVGANEWRTHYNWPPQTEIKRLQLSSYAQANHCDGGRLLMDHGEVDHKQSVVSQKDGEKITYVYNPENPVLSHGGSGFILPVNDEMKAGALFQEGYCERDDVVTFLSEPLTNDMTIIGEIKVQLHVASSGEDSAFTAKVMDVQPDGKALLVRDSISTLALRNDAQDFLEYQPESIVDIDIDMESIEWTVKKGHRLRLDISSSNFPVFNIHSNYAGPWAEQTRRKIATQTVYAPSHLELPIASEVLSATAPQ